jgi:hypothetical protein
LSASEEAIKVLPLFGLESEFLTNYAANPVGRNLPQVLIQVIASRSAVSPALHFDIGLFGRRITANRGSVKSKAT